MIENAERTGPQAGKQYFRVLKMIYKRDTGAVLDAGVVADVNALSVTTTVLGVTPLTKTDSSSNATPKARRRPLIVQDPCRWERTS